MKKSLIFPLILIGITAISSQVILLREFLTIFYGNELSVGFLLCVWLIGGATGSAIASRKGGKNGEAYLKYLAKCQIFLSLLIPSSVVLMRISRPVLGLSLGEIMSIPTMLFVALLSFAPICLTLGFMFVVGCQIYEARNPEKKIAGMYLLESIGAGVGGLVTSMILIRSFGNLQIAFFIALLNLMALAPLASHMVSRKTLYRFTAIGFLLAFVLLHSLGGVRFLDSLSLRYKWKGISVLESKDSIYGNVAVTKMLGQYTIFTNGLIASSAPDLLTAEESVHFPMLQHPQPKNILLIGNGTGDILDEILKYPVRKIIYVELDPLVTKMASKHLAGQPWYRLDDDRVEIINTDARYFIKHTEKHFDVAIINLPNPYTAQINRFYTVEFYREISKVLNKNAIISFSVISSENYVSNELAEFLRSIYRTVKKVFPDVQIVPGDNAYFLAATEAHMIDLDYNALERTRTDKGIDTYFVRAHYLKSKLSSDRMGYINEMIKASGSKGLRAINKDFRPISYYYDMILWSTYFSNQLSHFFGWLIKIKLHRILTLIGVIVLILAFLGRKARKYKYFATLFALASTGCSEITFQVLTLLAFQVLFGYLYVKLGLIITAFMIGLAAGTFYISRRLDRIRRYYETYILVQVFVLLYSIVLMLVFFCVAHVPGISLKPGGGDFIFSCLPFIAGFVGGLQFPLANKICLLQNNRVTSTAGITYSSDLLGASIGVLLASTLLIPLFGIYGTGIAIAVVNLFALVLLFLGKTHGI